MRLFIGIKPGNAHSELFSTSRYLAKLSGGRATKRENLHLTLKFLGEIEDPKPVIAAMKRAAENKQFFYLQLNDIIFLPKREMIWCDIEGDTKELKRLHRDVEIALIKNGVKIEKRAILPHITLVRKVQDEKFDVSDVRIEQIMFKVNDMVLFESKHIDGELTYIPIETITFGD